MIRAEIKDVDGKVAIRVPGSLVSILLDPVQADYLGADLAHKYATEVVVISRAEYDSLERDSEKLAALESAGVDNWEHYGAAMESLAQSRN